MTQTVISFDILMFYVRYNVDRMDLFSLLKGELSQEVMGREKK